MDATKELILIIEDDAGLVELLNESIQEIGYHAVCVTSAGEAFNWLDGNTPDLLLLDYSLPDMTAKDFITKLKELSAFVPPFILATGRGDERTAVEMMKLGARDYIVKDNHFLEMIPLVVEKICKEIRNENSLKKTQQALTESYVFNSQIIESAQEGIVVYSPQMEVLTWNRFMEKTTGALSTDIVGKRVFEVFRHKVEVGLEDAVIRALNGEKVSELEFSFRNLSNNEIVWVSDVVSTLRNADGDIVGAISTVRDITEKKRAEREIQKTTAEFKDLFDNAPIGYHEIDIDGKIVRINKTELDLLGYEIDEVVGRNVWEFVEDSEMSMMVTKEKFKNKQISSIPYERKFVTKAGTTVPVLVKDRFIISEDGEITGIQSSIQDISELKNAEQILRTRESYLTAIIENLPGIIWLKDTESHFLTANSNFARTFGQGTPENLVGKTDLDISPVEYATKYMADDKKVVDTKTPLFTTEVIVEDGTQKWFETFKMPVLDELGNVIGTTGYAQDISERKEAENEVVRISKHYQAIIEKSPDGFVLLDHEMHFAYASPAALRMFGYNQEDLTSTNPDEVTHPDDLGYVLPQLQRMLEDPTFIPVMEYRFRHKNGDWIWIESTFSNLFADPAVNAVVINFRNVDERKLTEHKLKVNEEKFRAVFEDSIVGKSITTFDGTLSVNKAFSEIVGYSLEELSTMNWVDITHKDDVENNNQIVQSIIKGERDSAHWEKRYIHKNGNIVWVDISATKLPGIESVSEGMITEIYDITARKEAEENLKASEERYRMLAENTNDVIWKITMDGKYTYISPSVLQLRGYTAEEVMNQSIEEVVSPESKEIVMKDFERSLKEYYQNNVIKSEYIEIAQPCKDGSIVWTESSAQLVFDTEGNPAGYVGVSRNITERKLAEKELQNNRDILNKLLHSNTEFIDSNSESIDYQKITDTITELSGAKYCSFNMLCDNNSDFVTVSMSGVDSLRQTFKSLFGYELVGKKWKHDEYKEKKIAGRIITKFESLAELSEAVFSKSIVKMVTKMFNLGEVWVVQIKAKNRVIGDFTLLCEREKTISNMEVLELYVSQLGLYLERINSEKALRASEELYRNLVHRIPDGVYKSTPAGKFLEVNQAMVNMFGYNSKEELLNIHIPTDLYFQEADRAVLLKNHEGDDVAIFRQKKKDGTVIWVEDHGWFNKDSSGQIISHEGVLRDITERKLAEDKLKSSYSLLNATLESTADGVLVVDKNGLTTVYNQRFAEMWRIPAELLEERIDEQMLRYVLTQLDNPTEFINKVNDLYKHPELSSIDDIKLADGRIFERYSIPQLINDEIVGRVWSFRDITDRIIATNAIRESEANLSEALEISNLCFWEYNAKSDLFLFNDQFYRIYHTTAEEQGGFTMTSAEYVKRFVHPDDVKAVELEVTKMLGAADIHYRSKIDHRIICGDGMIKYISVNIRVDEVNNGVLVRSVGANQDITERKNNEELLAKSEMFFRQSQQAGKIGSYNLNMSSGLWDSSDVLDEILGIDDSYVRSVEGWITIIAPEDSEMMATYFQEYVIGQRKSFDKEYRIKRKKDGEIRWVLGRGELLIENDTITAMVGTIQDISERKVAEIQLEEKMAELMRFQKVTVGRELVMIELKKEINELYIRLGLQPKFKIVE